MPRSTLTENRPSSFSFRMLLKIIQSPTFVGTNCLRISSWALSSFGSPEWNWKLQKSQMPIAMRVRFTILRLRVDMQTVFYTTEGSSIGNVLYHP
jgi:hypothetical protein